MPDWKSVRLERDGELAVLTIDRQEKLNALNAEVVRELDEAFRSARDDDEVLGIVVTGAGRKAFVAGADIGELAELDTLSGVERTRRGQEVLRSIERSPKPVLAAVGGYALGGGCELALACHLRVASENARFGQPEVGLGIIPGYGGTVRLTRIVGLGRALEIILTGEPVSAQEAEVMGLVSSVVPRDELMERATELLRKVTSNGPVAVRMALESVYRALDTSTDEALAHESSLFGLLASTDDMKEGTSAFLEKREPDFEGR